MLYLLDRLADSWLYWRRRRCIQTDPELARFNVHAITVKNHALTISAEAPLLAMLGQEAGKLLDMYDAKNYVQFDMISWTAARGRAVRVTVQWANGESPAVKAARLEVELDRIRTKTDES